MSLTMNPFHLEVNPTVLIAVLTMAANAVQAYLSHARNLAPRLGDRNTRRQHHF